MTRVFSGKAGDQVLLGISVATTSAGTPANIVSVTYNQKTVIAPGPFKITLASGDHGIVVVSISQPDTRISIDEVDALTGPLLGRAKSATFRTADITGLDVLLHVSKGLSASTGCQRGGISVTG